MAIRPSRSMGMSTYIFFFSFLLYHLFMFTKEKLLLLHYYYFKTVFQARKLKIMLTKKNSPQFQTALVQTNYCTRSWTWTMHSIVLVPEDVLLNSIKRKGRRLINLRFCIAFIIAGKWYYLCITNMNSKDNTPVPNLIESK